MHATPIVSRVDNGMRGGFPISGVNAPFTHATIGVVMKPKPKGTVTFAFVVVLVVEVLFVCMFRSARIA